MLDFLPFGRNKKSADPLGSLKAATVWMQELPMGDTFSAHEKVVAALKEFNEQGQPATRDRLQILMHLDEGAQDLQNSLAQQYLRNPRMSRQIESRLWNGLFAFNWELARGYHIFIMFLRRRLEQERDPPRPRLDYRAGDPAFRHAGEVAPLPLRVHRRESVEASPQSVPSGRARGIRRQSAALVRPLPAGQQLRTGVPATLGAGGAQYQQSVSQADRNDRRLARALVFPVAAGPGVRSGAARVQRRARRG